MGDFRDHIKKFTLFWEQWEIKVFETQFLYDLNCISKRYNWVWYGKWFISCLFCQSLRNNYAMECLKLFKWDIIVKKQRKKKKTQVSTLEFNLPDISILKNKCEHE